MFLKTGIAVLMLLASNPLLADKPLCSETPGGCLGNPPGHLLNKPECSQTPGGCAVNPPGYEVRNQQGHKVGSYNGQVEDKTATVPEPGPLALLVLGLAGMLVARKRKR
jgi:hypothetical protein